MGEATQPLPAITDITDTAALIAAFREAAAEFRWSQELYRELLAGGFRPPVEVIERNNRDAELDFAIRKATMFTLTDTPVSTPAPLAAVPEVPRSRHRKGRTRQRAPGEHPIMTAVKGFAPVAAFAAVGHRVVHVKLAAAVAAVGGSAVIGGTLVTAVPAITHAAAGTPGGTSSTVPGWHTSAIPLTPQERQYETELTTARERRHGRSSASASSSLPLAPYPPAAGTTPASPPSSQPSQPSSPAGPAQLTVSTTAIDLSSATTAEVTLSATGSGWASWRVDAGGQTDLDFSATHGVLQAGQSVTVTVSLDATQDSAATETFTIGGQSVTASLPAAPQPSVAPAAATTDPAIPSEAPSPASS